MKMFLGKIRKGLASAVLAFCCAAAGAANVSAVSENEIELKANGSEAGLELCFPQGAAEEISSMQISVSVKSSSDHVYVEFIPDGGLASKITESRYQSDTGVLNIYLAGTDTLFSEGGLLTVGRVKISGDGSASAVVGVVEDSFKFVRGGELISPVGEIGYPAPVSLTTAGFTADSQESNLPESNTAESRLPESSPAESRLPESNTAESNSPESSLPKPDMPITPEQTAASVSNDTVGRYSPSGNVFPVYVAKDGDLLPTVPVVGGHSRKNDGDADTSTAGEAYAHDTEQPTAQDMPGENLNPADTSALQDVLTRADSYDPKDFSDNSYGELNEAVNNANELLADPNATQDEIDDAALDVENAIGMLALRSDIPSGAEGYGAHDNIDGGYYNAANGGNTVENGEALPLGQGGNYAPGSDGQDRGDNAVEGKNAAGSGNMLISENERLAEGGGGGIIAVGFAMVIAAAAAAVIVIKRPKKGKGMGGKHFRK